MIVSALLLEHYHTPSLSGPIQSTWASQRHCTQEIGVMGFRTRDKVEVGSIAPDFILPSQSGQMVSLKDFIGEKPVVLFFYPKDGTLGCTKEACAFRDDYEGFGKLDAEVIGISSDSVESHRSFAAKHDLPYTLLSDEERKLRKLYGVPNTLGIFPGRVR